MKFCTRCGSELLDAAVICPKCGESAEPPKAALKETKPKTYSALSIVGFVFAFLFPLAGLICSILAFKNAQVDENVRCKSFAKAGIIISAVLLSIEVISNLVYIILRACQIAMAYHFNYWRLFFDLLF